MEKRLFFPKYHSISDIGSSGQVAIIILLIMVVLMTIGLSIASRSTQDLFLANQKSESSRVFNAAEAGIEDALSQDFSSITQDPVTITPDLNIADANIDYTITPHRDLEVVIRQGGQATIDLSGQTGNKLTIRWGRNGGCNDGSLIISTYYDDKGEIKATQQAISPCDRGDDFSPATDIDIDGYKHEYLLTVDPNAADNTIDLQVRVMAVYNDVPIKVTGTNLPAQYHTLRSSANTTLGNEQRVVEVKRSISSAPTIMDYALFSGTDILK